MNKVSATKCPSAETLASLFVGTVETTDELEAHLRSCAHCQSRLNNLSESTGLEMIRSTVDQRLVTYTFLGEPLRDGDLGSIDHLLVEEEIGRGGLGVVFRAYDDQLKRYVAVKVLNNDSNVRSDARFERESKAAANVRGDFVVSVHSIGQTADHRPFLVMPLVRGRSLREKLASELPAPRESAKIIRQIAMGLQAVHQANLIHRDVKPANILIDEQDDRAKLTDFGLARALTDETLTQANVLCGTPEYMSPEQSAGMTELSQASDIYSLGITLYECLTGTAPFRGGPIQVLQQHRTVQPVAPSRLSSDVPRDLETICLKAIAKEPDRRYGSAQSMADDLERFLDGRPIQAQPVSSIHTFWMWCRRNRALSAALLLLASSLVAGTAVSTTMWIRSKANATKANRFASDLQENRQRLRDSVSRFQGKIFSDQALHLQMPESFRTEMFNDVIEYLDEFTAFDGADDRALDDGSYLALTRDYYNVARSALAVSEFEQARLAADRVLNRIRPLADSKVIEVHLLHSRAAGIACAAQQALDRPRGELQALATEGLSAANKAVSLAENNRDTIAAGLQARFLKVQTDHGPGEQKRVALSQLYKELDSFRQHLVAKTEADRVIAATAIEIGWSLAALSAPERGFEILQDNDAQWIVLLRESFFVLQKPLLEYHFLRGKNSIKMAILQHELGDCEAALKTAGTGDIDLRKAVEGSPQRREWRLEFAHARILVSDLYRERQEFKLATVYLDDAIRSHVRLLQSDTQNHQMRRQVIRLLAKVAELAIDEQNFDQAAETMYMAAQDCRLLLHNTPSRKWAFDRRLWLLARIVELVPKIENQEFIDNFWAIEKKFVEAAPEAFSEFDTSQIQPILDGDYKPDRPTDMSLTYRDVYDGKGDAALFVPLRQ